MNEQEETNSRLVSRLVGVLFFFFRREKRTCCQTQLFSWTLAWKVQRHHPQWGELVDLLKYPQSWSRTGMNNWPQGNNSQRGKVNFRGKGFLEGRGRRRRERLHTVSWCTGVLGLFKPLLVVLQGGPCTNVPQKRRPSLQLVVDGSTPQRYFSRLDIKFLNQTQWQNHCSWRLWRPRPTLLQKQHW